MTAGASRQRRHSAGRSSASGRNSGKSNGVTAGRARHGAGAFLLRPVFEGVSFLLDDAKTALVGENGAGKSTLLKCLAAELERPPILRRKQCVYRLDYSYT